MSMQPHSNVPPQNRDPMEFMPSLGTPVQQGVMGRETLDATDRNIPKVQLASPSWLSDTISVKEQAPSVPQFSAPQTSFSHPREAQPQYRAGDTPAPNQGRVPGSVQLPDRPVQHPVINSLLADLGFSDAKLVNTNIANHVFTQRQLNADMFAFALSTVSRASSTNDEYAMRLNLTLGALSVVKIDGAPSYALASVDVSKAGTFDDSNPPFAVYSKSTSFLLDLFFSKLDFKIVETLADTYDKNWGTKDADADLLAMAGAVDAEDKRVRFKCSVEGCKHVEDVVPEFLDGSGSVRARFCPEHGDTMTPLGYLSQLANVPLA